jgi:cobalamin-dependent methionine synthase I
MSALLTTTMPYMKVVIDTLKERGIRNDYIVLVGGAPLNEEFGKAVGADAYCRDAAVAVETAKGLIATRRAGARRTERRAARWRRRARPRPAGHRLRRAGARDHGAAPRQRLGCSSTCAACRPSCTTARSDSRRRCAR